MSEQSGSLDGRAEEIARLRARLAELEDVQEEAVEEAVEEAAEEIEEAVEEAAEEAAEEIEAATGEEVTPDERQVLAGIIAAQVVESLTPYLNIVPPPDAEEVAEAVVEEPEEVVVVHEDEAPISRHWTERRLWGGR